MRYIRDGIHVLLHRCLNTNGLLVLLMQYLLSAIISSHDVETCVLVYVLCKMRLRLIYHYFLEL
jgi:hypothetical protein